MTALPVTASRTGPGWSIRVVTSRLMQTNCTLVAVGADVLVVDAPYFPDELAALPALAGAGRVQLLATHSHFDHLMARYAFPDAPLLIAAATAAELARDPARPLKDLEAEDSRTYVRRGRPLVFGALRGVRVPGWVEIGERDGELLAAPGHTADGTALWLEWAGVLCCGDYLSDVEIPLVSRAGSPSDYRQTLERLAPLARKAQLVVPGHGSPCDGAEADRRLQADLAYLESLAADDRDQPLPAGRQTPRQREIHRANLQRHGPRARRPKKGR